MSIPFTNDKILSNNSFDFKIDRWYGLNVSDTYTGNGECVSMKNINSNGYNLYPRPPREIVTSGINNPQKVLFCGDKLSYISDGNLYVESDGEYINKGNVGNVSSVVDFSNRDVLFYPSNSKYSLTDGTLSTVTEYLEVVDNSDVIYEYNKRIKGRSLYLKANGSRYINMPLLYNADGTEKKDENGNQLYGSAVFNATGIPEKFITYDYDDPKHYNIRLVVYGVDATGTKNTGEMLFNFGEEVFLNSSVSRIAVDILVYLYNRDDVINYTSCQLVIDDLLSNKDFKVWLTQSNYPAPNSCPHIDFACMDNNRVFGVSKNNIYASSLGNYANWSDFVDEDGSPKSTGAYAEELYSLGDFTGVYKFRSNVVITKRNSLYECYGNKPPYRTNLVSKTGCIDHRSMVEVNNILYWLGPDGVYRYAGSVPIKVSEKIDKLFGELKGGVASTDGKNYYISIDDGTCKRLMVFDTATGLWCMEDQLDIVDMTSNDGTVYALTADGEILKFNSGNEQVEWEYETKTFDFDITNKKIVRDLCMYLTMESGTKTDVYISFDSGQYKRVATYSANKKTVASFRLKVKKCDCFKLLIKGIGNVIVQSLNGTVVSVGRSKTKKGLISY